jgi:hypothetical protein
VNVTASLSDAYPAAGSCTGRRGAAAVRPRSCLRSNNARLWPPGRILQRQRGSRTGVIWLDACVLASGRASILPRPNIQVLLPHCWGDEFALSGWGWRVKEDPR